MQECEARIAIERVLADEKLKSELDADLVARCDAALQERLHALQLCRGGGEREVLGSCWFLTSGWEDRAERLFTLAGEVERKVGRRRSSTERASLWGESVQTKWQDPEAIENVGPILYNRVRRRSSSCSPARRPTELAPPTPAANLRSRRIRGLGVVAHDRTERSTPEDAMREILARSIVAAQPSSGSGMTPCQRGGRGREPSAERRLIGRVGQVGLWRIHCELSPPTLPTGEPVKLKHQWMNYKTAAAAGTGWSRSSTTPRGSGDRPRWPQRPRWRPGSACAGSSR